MNRSELRAALLASTPRRSKLVTIPVNGMSVEVELRQLTLAERDAMVAAAQAFANRAAKSKTNVTIPNGVLITHTLIAAAHVPGTTDEKVFEPADAQVLLSAGIGGWVEEVVAATASLMNAEAEAVGKDSAETSSA